MQHENEALQDNGDFKEKKTEKAVTYDLFSIDFFSKKESLLHLKIYYLPFLMFS